MQDRVFLNLPNKPKEDVLFLMRLVTLTHGNVTFLKCRAMANTATLAAQGYLRNKHKRLPKKSPYTHLH